VERLIEVQRKLNYKDILQCIQDVPTRWNSLYYAWDRLFYLKDAIIKLQADLYTSINRDEKKDGSKLKQIMLSEEEWELLDQLVDLLLPFEEATRDFSGSIYITLSKMIPKIKELIFNLADGSSLNSNEYLDDNDNDNAYESEEDILLIEIDNNDVIS